MKRQSWKSKLAAILSEHNHRHGSKNKVVSNITKYQRSKRLFHCFHILWELGYKIEDPRNLAQKHIRALMDYWIENRFSPGTIQKQLSHLRVLCEWMGKHNMVKKASAYVDDPALVKRTYAAKTDCTWPSRGVDIERLFARVAEEDAYVVDQLRAELLFGLRPKEAMMLKPHQCDLGSVLCVTDGTKGGRPRTVKIRHPEQREALDAWKERCGANESLSDQKLSLEQAINRYYRVMDACGITKKELGIWSYGLRKQYANTLYREMTGVASPVQGGTLIDYETDHAARLLVAEDLGHSREQITNAYLGAPRRTRPKRPELTEAAIWLNARWRKKSEKAKKARNPNTGRADTATPSAGATSPAGGLQAKAADQHRAEPEESGALADAST